MKTLTFVLYFVAILGLIEANWRVIDDYGNSNFDNNDKQNFLRYARSAMLQRGGIRDKMGFLRRKMEQEWGIDGHNWNCFYGSFGGSWYHDTYSITIKNDQLRKKIVCFML